MDHIEPAKSSADRPSTSILSDTSSIDHHHDHQIAVINSSTASSEADPSSFLSRSALKRRYLHLLLPALQSSMSPAHPPDRHVPVWERSRDVRQAADTCLAQLGGCTAGSRSRWSHALGEQPDNLSRRAIKRTRSFHGVDDHHRPARDHCNYARDSTATGCRRYHRVGSRSHSAPPQAVISIGSRSTWACMDDEGICGPNYASYSGAKPSLLDERTLASCLLDILPRVDAAMDTSSKFDNSSRSCPHNLYHGMDLPSLLHETTDYILALQTQVDTLTTLVNANIVSPLPQ